MNKISIFFVVFYLMICLGCGGFVENKTNDTSMFFQTSEQFWEDLKTGKNVVEYFDSNFINIDDINKIKTRFSECGIKNSTIQYVSYKNINDKFGLCCEIEYLTNLGCGKKRIFITYLYDDSNKIIGLHVSPIRGD